MQQSFSWRAVLGYFKEGPVAKYRTTRSNKQRRFLATAPFGETKKLAPSNSCKNGLGVPTLAPFRFIR